eukprot:g6040.t1
MCTHLEFRDGRVPSKFWEITVEGDSFTVRQGRCGEVGEVFSVNCGSARRARKTADLNIQDKLRKGYEVTFELNSLDDWDEEEGGGGDRNNNLNSLNSGGGTGEKESKTNGRVRSGEERSRQNAGYGQRRKVRANIPRHGYSGTYAKKVPNSGSRQSSTTVWSKGNNRRHRSRPNTSNGSRLRASPSSQSSYGSQRSYGSRESSGRNRNKSRNSSKSTTAFARYGVVRRPRTSDGRNRFGVRVGSGGGGAMRLGRLVRYSTQSGVRPGTSGGLPRKLRIVNKKIGVHSTHVFRNQRKRVEPKTDLSLNRFRSISSSSTTSTSKTPQRLNESQPTMTSSSPSTTTTEIEKRQRITTLPVSSPTSTGTGLAGIRALVASNKANKPNKEDNERKSLSKEKISENIEKLNEGKETISIAKRPVTVVKTKPMTSQDEKETKVKVKVKVNLNTKKEDLLLQESNEKNRIEISTTQDKETTSQSSDAGTPTGHVQSKQRVGVLVSAPTKVNVTNLGTKMKSKVSVVSKPPTKSKIPLSASSSKRANDGFLSPVVIEKEVLEEKNNDETESTLSIMNAARHGAEQNSADTFVALQAPVKRPQSAYELSRAARRARESLAASMAMDDSTVPDNEYWMDPLSDMDNFGTPLWKKDLEKRIVPMLNMKKHGIGGEAPPRRERGSRGKSRSHHHSKHYGHSNKAYMKKSGYHHHGLKAGYKIAKRPSSSSAYRLKMRPSSSHHRNYMKSSHHHSSHSNKYTKLMRPGSAATRPSSSYSRSFGQRVRGRGKGVKGVKSVGIRGTRAGGRRRMISSSQGRRPSSSHSSHVRPGSRGRITHNSKWVGLGREF